MPAALVRADRRALAVALVGHVDRASRLALASLLMDADLSVRQAAGATLTVSFGERLVFDPLWDESRRRVVAERLRALHHRRP